MLFRSAGAGRGTCASSAGSFSAEQPGPWNSAAISAGNLENKRRACASSNNDAATAIFTEGASCSLVASLGHCAHQVTNVYSPSTQRLEATVTTQWSVP